MHKDEAFLVVILVYGNQIWTQQRANMFDTTILLNQNLNTNVSFTYRKILSFVLLWHRYHVAALSVAAFYSFITCVISILAMMKPCGNSAKLKFHLVILDSLLLGIMAAAMGATGGVAYITLKGNSHSENNKLCDTYGSYCFHFAAAILMSFIVSITLLPLIWLSVYMLSKIARK